MKKYLLLSLCLSVCTTLSLTAQTEQGSYHHNLRGILSVPVNTGSPYSPLSTGQSGTGANIDVIYQKCFWRINPDSSVKYIRGYVQTNFKTITSPVTAISFDLNSVLTVDSVRFRGAKLAAGNITRSGHILNIALGASLGNAVTDSVWVYYRGTPPNVVGQAEGYQSNTTKGVPSPAGGSYIYTLSESYEDRDWWPCKADMKDKIDSMDIIVSVPWGTPTAADTFWVAANGKLVDSTINGTSRQFTFQTRYATPSYLVAVGVARYKRYYRTPVNIGGTNVPVVYNLYAGKTAGTYTSILKSLDSGSVMLSKFSAKYGDYPFKNEKHGYYEFGWGGGMEHQTFSAMGGTALQAWDVVAHELMHQWFGDAVTFATWNDLWLAEGFAKYGEALAIEMMPGLSGTSTDSSWRRTIKNSALTFTGANSQGVYIPVGSMENSDLIWASNYGTTVYDRGAMVVSMLRALAGDAIYFQACKNYLANSAYKAAVTDSLKNNFNALLGVDLTPFFNDYVYGNGNPIYNNTIAWNNYATNKLIIQVGAQTKSASSSVSYFHTPIVLRVQGAAGKDTTIVIYDLNGSLARAGNGISAPVAGNVLTYNLSFNPTSVKFDNKHQTMASGGTINVTTLDLKIIDFSARNSGTYNEAFVTMDDNSINSSLVLEKSRDGIAFADAGIMSLTGSGTSKKYYFQDLQPFSNTNYYRVKYKDLTGEFVYSKIIKITNGRAGSFSILNNPVKGMLNVKSTEVNNAVYSFNILTEDGKLVSSEARNVYGAMLQFDVRKLVAGTYILKIFNSRETEDSLKFVVQ